MSIERVMLLGLGEVGSTLAQDLLAQRSCGHLRVWDLLLDEPGSAPARHLAQLAEDPRVERAVDAVTAAQDCQLVISAVTAAQAVAASRSLLASLPAGCWFLDLNSVSPATKAELALEVDSAGGRFVEAAVMSPIHPRRMASPVLLSGPHAAGFEPVGRALGFTQMTTVSSQPGVAAATKMCRSVMIKGMEALVSESLLAARHYGVEDAVLASLENLFPRPDWSAHAHYLITRTLQHGARRAEEMREVARTVSEAGIDPWMSSACVQRQDWAANFKNQLCHTTLDELLDGLLAEIRAASADPSSMQTTGSKQ